MLYHLLFQGEKTLRLRFFVRFNGKNNLVAEKLCWKLVYYTMLMVIVVKGSCVVVYF